MTRKHIAGKGKKKGQWVKCDSKGKCKLVNADFPAESQSSEEIASKHNDLAKFWEEKDKKASEIIAQEDERFNKVKKFNLTVSGSGEDKQFAFTDRNGKAIVFDKAKVEKLKDELDKISDNYSFQISKFIDDYNDETADTAPDYYKDTIHVAALNESITYEETDMLYAEISDELSGREYDEEDVNTYHHGLVSSFKRANADAIMFEQSLNLDQD